MHAHTEQTLVSYIFHPLYTLRIVRHDLKCRRDCLQSFSNAYACHNVIKGEALAHQLHPHRPRKRPPGSPRRPRRRAFQGHPLRRGQSEQVTLRSRGGRAEARQPRRVCEDLRQRVKRPGFPYRLLCRPAGRTGSEGLLPHHFQGQGFRPPDPAPPRQEDLDRSFRLNRRHPPAQGVQRQDGHGKARRDRRQPQAARIGQAAHHQDALQHHQLPVPEAARRRGTHVTSCRVAKQGLDSDHREQSILRPAMTFRKRTSEST